METIANENIIIKQVLMRNGEPAYVEYWSTKDSRNCILSAIHFCDNFGYTIEELLEHPEPPTI